MMFENNFFLAKKLSLGDNKAFDFLVSSFYQKLCTYAYTLINDHGKAEDIVQNVFAKTWVHRKKINPNFSIKSYLYKSTYNEFIDLYRKNQPVVYLEKKYLEAIDLIVENEGKNLNELMELVNYEIDNLPKKCKQIFLLNKKEGLTHIEISNYLGVSIKTVEGHITRAFKTLREKLGSKAETLLFLLFDFEQINFSQYTTKNKVN
ncbi:RNA polymerase sigma-70 factor [Flavivirga abyssicola]|uniref:RNA polymerase sigma factor n=1 Tax=Flavivirga abyssicola TaxID=3063533 RepID=UPI0026DFB1F2|nr:RNA polymerase sigma-70 factor [Flavivirga sp. MEBiC07777]WVK12566.1 RNA polymerase sigma-70 factor [Flavivirga sp. MEBiC07777]